MLSGSREVELGNSSFNPGRICRGLEVVLCRYKQCLKDLEATTEDIHE